MSKKYKNAMTIDQIAQIDDKDIDYSDIPELDNAFFEKARLLMPQTKKPVSLRLDEDVLEWFKSQQKRGYQGHINAVLRAYMVTQERPQ